MKILTVKTRWHRQLIVEVIFKTNICRSIDEARETYEQLVQTFPTCGRYWKTYIEQEVKIKINIVNTLLGLILDDLDLKFDSIYYVIVCFIFLQIRARNYERVEKVNKGSKKV